MTDQEIQLAFAEWTLNMESRRDKNGNLKVYPLPDGDGGGTFEVAGINDRYHPKMARRLRSLIESGEHEQAEKEAKEYLDNYTNAVDEWHPDERVEGYLRCCAFNRGEKGAAWILQYALKFGFTPSLYANGRRGLGGLDGDYGTNTKKAAYSPEAQDVELMITLLAMARTVYERTSTKWKGHRTEESVFWHGLFRRFAEDADFALSLRV